jgi:3-mercaptopyruvate sulfurtransferase SseA
MESLISTKDLKAKLDRKQKITVVETLALERYREAHIPGALNAGRHAHVRRLPGGFR